MLNDMHYTLPAAIRGEVDREIALWNSNGKVDRLWNKDATLWTNDDESKWLGWLHIVGEELTRTGRYSELARDIESTGFTDILLMGMGGSSLGPEVLALTFGKAHFQILDSTVPAQVKAVEDSLDLSKTLFIVASKSGSTLEPNCFKQYFFDLVAESAGRENAGKQFVAITDPGSKMEQVAKDDGFRHIFFGEPEIGGRFSALSAFGLTAAAAMGLDVERFLRSADEMATACKLTDADENPGAALGAILGMCHKTGRDKMTIFTSPEIENLGAWLEQLIAESTGKNGVSIIPIDREPLMDTARYGNDRIFVFLGLKGDASQAAVIKALTTAGHPVIQIALNGIESLGQEFFRWEFATAVAGSVMHINPFNQPDVESAKIEARKITDEYEQSGTLPVEDPFFTSEGLSLYTSKDYAGELGKLVSEQAIVEFLKAHLSQLSTNDYFALLAYVEMTASSQKVLAVIRAQVQERYGNATCLGFGPRFLHSTGQAYKGGANNGVFLQITADDAIDLPVPGQKYSFGVVKAAQARGDFQVLVDRGRRALRIHIHGDAVSGLNRILDLIQ